MGFISPFNNLDLLTIPISLSYKEKYFYRTFCGAVLTIAFIIILLAYFISEFIQIIKKSSFSIITNEYQNPKETIDFTNVPILFALTDDVGNPLHLNSKMAKYSVIINEYILYLDKYGNSNTKHTTRNLEIERCDKLIDSLDMSIFKDYNISYFQCIKPFQNIKINGSYGDIKGYTSLKISVQRYNTENNDCYSTEYIDTILSNSRFMIAYLGYKTNYFDSNSKDIEKTIYSRSITLSPNFLKRVFYYMTFVKYNLYDNIFNNEKKETIYYINRDTILESEPIKNESYDKDTLAYYSFVYDGNVVEYTKKVSKLIDVISYTGNLFNIMLTLFKIINNYFSNKILFIDIFYQFFFDRKFRPTKSFHLDKNNKDKLMENDIINYRPKTLNNSIVNNFNSNLILDRFSESHKNLQILNRTKEQKYPDKINYKEIINFNNKKIEKEKYEFISFFKLYYLCPFWIIKNKKRMKTLYFMKNSICSCFSLESFIEFIKVEKAFKSKEFNNMNKNKNLGVRSSVKSFREEISKIFSIK